MRDGYVAVLKDLIFLDASNDAIVLAVSHDNNIHRNVGDAHVWILCGNEKVGFPETPSQFVIST